MKSVLETLVEKREMAMIVAYINREAICTGKFEILIMNEKYDNTMEDTICRYYQETKDETLKNYLMNKYGFMNDQALQVWLMMR